MTAGITSMPHIFAAVRSTLTLHSCRSSIEECPDEDPEKMKVKVSYVRLDGLASYVGKKVSSLTLGD